MTELNEEETELDTLTLKPQKGKPHLLTERVVVFFFTVEKKMQVWLFVSLWCAQKKGTLPESQ